jgi:S1-C subfamily serine protease
MNAQRVVETRRLRTFLAILAAIPWIFFLRTGSAQTVPSVPEVVNKVRPSVVQIITRQVSYDIFLRPVPSEGVGSGVIFDPRGHILTNSHVVEEAKQVQVFLPDGRKFPGKVMGKDPLTDLAVVMIQGKDLPSSPLGDSSKLQIGEALIAIGNALGLEGGPTVTVGVVSALNRSIEDPSGIALGDLIQTDAAINPGNSGGPLINLKGEVIGINTAVIPSAQGIGFAIAINSARPIAKELLEKGKVVRPWLGIAPVTITRGLAAAYDLPVEEGVVVAKVEKGTPAAKAGLKAGDIITVFGGDKVRNVAELRSAIAKKKIGDRVNVEINRDKRRSTVSLILGKMPEG